MRQGKRILQAGLVASLGAVTIGSAMAQDKTVTVWANKGFYEAMDSSLRDVVKRFEKDTGNKVNLSFYSNEDLITRAVSAVAAGSPPDFSFGLTYDVRTTGKWAYEGKLADVSDVVGPMKDKFLPGTLETTYLFNEKVGKKAYYAVPIGQNILHTFYWRDMLEEAGFTQADIPTEWAEYWSFWCDKVQPALRKKGQRTYGIGLPYSVQASDTFFGLLTFLNAHNVQVVDEDGKLLLDDPKNRKGIELALTDYSKVYEQKCTPPSSINWGDVDNNVNFNNRTTVMTPNATISIPASYLDAMNKQDATAEQKEIARKNYHENLVTAAFPKKPDGSVLPNLTSVKTGMVFADAKNIEGGKQFMEYLMRDENVTSYLESMLGVWYPVTKYGADRPFWTDGKDPHRAVARKMFEDGVVPFQFVYNWRFTIVNAENVWAQALARISQDNVSPAQATDEMIKRIQTIVEQP